MNNSLFRRIIYKSKFLGGFFGYISTSFQFRLLYFYKDRKAVDLIKSIKKEVDFAFYPYEAFMVYSLVKSQCKLEGDFAEIGVYQGGSAKLICEAKGVRKLYLFDTFEGLPDLSEKDTHFGMKFWKKKQFDNTTVESVKKYLSMYTNVFLYKGKFPETAKAIENCKFSFVHLDVDLYRSTLDCLKFFYPRLTSGGIILSHDYHTNGVRTAFEEFFSDKEVPVIELTGSQCIVIKNN